MVFGFAYQKANQLIQEAFADNTITPIAIGAVLTTGSFLQTVSLISIFLAATFIAALFLLETEGKILS